MRALVVGGGIGGLATAIALARAGHEPGRLAQLSSPRACAVRDVVVRALPDRLAAAQQARVFRVDLD
jgi:glycine/D-amino acid oxidase-like deaminating enzyme